MGLALLDALEAQEKAEFQLRIAETRSQAAGGVAADALRAWHRQWWLMLPLGVLIGFAAAATTLIALDRG